MSRSQGCTLTDRQAPRVHQLSLLASLSVWAHCYGIPADHMSEANHVFRRWQDLVTVHVCPNQGHDPWLPHLGNSMDSLPDSGLVLMATTPQEAVTSLLLPLLQAFMYVHTRNFKDLGEYKHVTFPSSLCILSWHHRYYTCVTYSI